MHCPRWHQHLKETEHCVTRKRKWNKQKRLLTVSRSCLSHDQMTSPRWNGSKQRTSLEKRNYFRIGSHKVWKCEERGEAEGTKSLLGAQRKISCASWVWDEKRQDTVKCPRMQKIKYYIMPYREIWKNSQPKKWANTKKTKTPILCHIIRSEKTPN